MWFQIGVVFVAIAFLMYLAAAFGSPIGALLTNGLIIFLIAYRVYFEIRAGRQRTHLLATFAAFIVLFLFGNFGQPFWLVTTFLVVEYVISVVVTLLPGSAQPRRIAPGSLRRNH